MSTRIYNGLRFTDISLETVFYRLQSYRKRVKELQSEAAAALVANLATSLIDRAALGMDVDSPGSFPQSPWGQAYSEFEDREYKALKSPGADPFYDTTFGLTVIPHDGLVYGALHVTRPDWRDDFYSQSWVERFDYWNDTDPPDDITPADWSDRARLWDAIYADEHLRPVDCGLSFEVRRLPLPPCLDDILKHIPSFEQRLHSKAYDAVIRRRAAARAADPESLTNPIDRMMSAAFWSIESPEGHEAIEAEKRRIEPLLAPVITPDMLKSRTRVPEELSSKPADPPSS